MRGDEDNGSGLLGGAELEDLGDAGFEGVDDVFVRGVTEDGEGACRMVQIQSVMYDAFGIMTAA